MRHGANGGAMALRAAEPLVPVRPSVAERGAWLAVFTLVLGWSGIAPHDYFTWTLEVLPALVAVVVLAWLWPGFALSRLASWFVLAHALVLMVGGHYTYAEVPLFNWLRDALGLLRNDYDKVGHFMQGFVPALLAREVLLRRTALVRGALLGVLVISVSLAISALYEILEWQVAIFSGTGATAFLGTQGDVWDTQSDMAWCGIGAVTSVITLRRWHDRQLGLA